MATPVLSDEQIAFLDHLFALYYQDDVMIDEQSYCFYEAQVEQWMAAGHYHDAMLKFWHGFPLAGLYSQQLDNFYNFVKVVNGLGFLMPSPTQAALLNSAAHIDRIRRAQTIDDKIDGIYSLWSAIEMGTVHDLAYLVSTFAKMREKNLLRETQQPAFNEQTFHHVYSQLLAQLSAWQQRYPEDKMAIYQSLIYRGEDFSQQIALLQSQPKTTLPTQPPSHRHSWLKNKWQQLQRWLKITTRG